MTNTDIQQKNIAIEALRFLFMIIICVHHLGGTPMKHGYIAVEFFFMLSGVMLMKTFMKPSHKGVVEYSWGRIKRLYPEYFIACILSGIVLWAIFRDGYEAGNIGDVIRRFINTLLLLNGTGVYMGGFNITLWYVVVLIIGGSIVYACIDYNKALSLKIVFPITVILYYTWCFNAGDSIERWNVEGGVFYNPLWRGMCDLMIGVIVYYLFRYYGKRVNTLFINTVSILSLMTSLILLFVETFYDAYYLLLFPPVIIGAMMRYSWLNQLCSSKKWIIGGGVSYEMYLVHIPIKVLCNTIFDKFHLQQGFCSVIVYLVATFVAAWMLKSLYKMMQKKIPCLN